MDHSQDNQGMGGSWYPSQPQHSYQHPPSTNTMAVNRWQPQSSTLLGQYTQPPPPPPPPPAYPVNTSHSVSYPSTTPLQASNASYYYPPPAGGIPPGYEYNNQPLYASRPPAPPPTPPQQQQQYYPQYTYAEHPHYHPQAPANAPHLALNQHDAIFGQPPQGEPNLAASKTKSKKSKAKKNKTKTVQKKTFMTEMPLQQYKWVRPTATNATTTTDTFLDPSLPIFGESASNDVPDSTTKMNAIETAAYGQTGKDSDSAAMMPSNVHIDATKRPSLAEAKAKLRKALMAKKTALLKKKQTTRQEMSNDKSWGNNHDLEPISALRKGANDCLIFTDIANSGPKEKVYFVDRIGAFRAEMEALGWGVVNDEEKLTSSTAAPCNASSSDTEAPNRAATQHKLAQLQKQLELAKSKKERLERQVSKDDEETTGLIAQSLVDTSKMTRQELLERRRQVERQKVLLHYKHLVAKQETLLLEQQAKQEETLIMVNQTTKRLQEAKQEMQQAKTKSRQVVKRRQALDELYSSYVDQLMSARKKLRDYKQDRE